jgi:hypothetical protein
MKKSDYRVSIDYFQWQGKMKKLQPRYIHCLRHSFTYFWEVSSCKLGMDYLISVQVDLKSTGRLPLPYDLWEYEEKENSTKGKI